MGLTGGGCEIKANSKHIMNGLLIVSAAFLIGSSSSLELDNKSEDVKVVKGQSNSFFCKSDAPMEFCQWDFGGNRICQLVSDKDGVQTCRDQNSVQSSYSGQISQDGQVCTLIINNVNSNDEGTYKCTLIRLNSPNVNAEIQVQVLTQARLEFEGLFKALGQIEVNLDGPALTLVTCSANGGFPEPTLSASIVNAYGNIVRDLDEDDHISKPRALADSVSRSFVFFPNLEDDGARVVCFADQDGFPKQSIERTIQVVYKPTVRQIKDSTFHYMEGQQTTVSVIFSANPVPREHEVIWHHFATTEPISPPPPGSFNLSPGQSTADSKYQALNLNISGHEVTATLIINDANDDLLKGTFYLEAFNPHGNLTHYFSFKEHSDDDGQLRADDEEILEDTKALGGGAIAAIIIIVLGIILGFSLVAWAKKNNRLCFRKPDHGPVPQNDPDSNDPEAGTIPPIIKQDPKDQNSSDKNDSKKNDQIIA